MSIQFTCESCDAKHLVNDRFAGKRVRCPKCESPMLVPMESDVEVASLDLVHSMGELASSSESNGRRDSVEVNTDDSRVSVPASEPPMRKQDLDDDEDDEPVLPRQRRPEEEMD
ncbi:MAG: zinc-ribbon domain-containing protein, partial [Rubripirellula sp.]|nr:zinc-ribbon domain-containing protein [Rubripirellula sp.]